MELDNRTRTPALRAVRGSAREACLALLILAGLGCSSGSDGTPGNSLGGGSGSGGERAASGGSAAVVTGGATATGGVASTGGATATGGVTSTGGVTAGGTTSTGGTSPTGGVSSTGGLNAGGTAGNTSGLGGSAGTAGSMTAVGGSAGRGGGGAGGGGGNAGGSGGNAVGGSSGSSSGGSSAGSAGRGSSGGAAGSGGSGGGASGYNPCPATSGTACSVLPLGDSITEGCCTAPYGGYRIELFRQAVTNRKNLTFVGSLSNGPDMVDARTFPKKHEGHGGWKISQIDGVVPSPALNTVPHIVLLMIGTNDINGNDDINNAPNRLGTLIDGLTTSAPSALIVVAAIIPTNNDGTNQRVQTYNSAMRNLVTTRAMAGKHVVFLDNYAAFSQNANYKTALMADSLHPNDAGYAVLGRSFYGLIGSLLPAAP